MKKNVNLSPNFSQKRRQLKDIKFIIIHYTGMQSEIESLNRLKDEKSKVSAHYFINRGGKITQLVKDNKIAWHAGKSKWKNFKNLNKHSIGIELVNKGEEYGYQNYTKIQIKSLIKLCRKLKKKYLINKENFLCHSDIAPLRKTDPGKKFPWKTLSKFKLGHWHDIKIGKNKKEDKNEARNLFFSNLYKIGYRYFSLRRKTQNDKYLVKAFQLRYLPNRVNGKIDEKTLNISSNLVYQCKILDK